MLGKKISEMEDHSPELVSLYHDLVSGKQVFASAEYGARHQRWELAHDARRRKPVGRFRSKISGVIFSVRDITVERKLEQQVVRANVWPRWAL